MNPAGVVAEGFAQATGCPLISDLLRYCRWTSKQGTLSRSERLRNVRRSMRVDRSYDIAGARLLLIDDVMASGATLNEAARAIRSGGAASVEAAVVARGIGTY
jgi:predicted amidophosphoribosyltransferase